MKGKITREGLLFFGLLFSIPLVSACLFQDEVQCYLSTDCVEGLFCHLGECVDFGASGPGREPFQVPASSGASDGEVGLSEPDKEEESEPHPCPEAEPATRENLVLNEFLAFVPTGDQGDANGDGVRHAHDDEFVELVNISEETIDMTSVVIRNDSTDRFEFPPFCLQPFEAVVVFGGIEPGVAPPFGDGWVSFIADSRFAYANGAGRVVVVDDQGGTIADYSYGAHPAESLNLSVELFGEDYVNHRAVHEEGIFSPGTCADGRPFRTRCLPED